MLLHKLPRRRPSAMAAWALRIASFCPVFASTAIVAHWFSIIDTPTFFVLVFVTAAIVVLAIFFIALGFRSLWVKGKRGGRKLAWAVVWVLLVAAPLGLAAYTYLTLPAVLTVSTDLVDPPMFAQETDAQLVSNRALIVSQLSDQFSDLTGRRYNTPSENVVAAIGAIATAENWNPTGKRSSGEAGDQTILEFTYKTWILALPGKIVVRVEDDEETSFVDIRAQSLYGNHDFGINAALILRFLDRLDFALIGSIAA